MSVERVLTIALAAATALLVAAFAATSRAMRVEEERRAPLREAGQRASSAAEAMRRAVEGAGVGMSWQEFSSLWLGLLALAALVCVMLSVSPAATLAVLALAACAPWLVLRSRRAAGRRRVSEDLGEVLPLVASSLRGGMTFRKAVSTAGDAMPEPTRSEFALLAADLAHGVATAEALARMAERTGSPDLVLLATAVSTTEVTGGNLSEIVDSAAAAVRQRSELRRMVASKTSEQRASAKVLVAVPVALTAYLILTQAAWRDFLLGDPLGLATLAVAALLVVVGYWVALRMTEIRLD